MLRGVQTKVSQSYIKSGHEKPWDGAFFHPTTLLLLQTLLAQHLMASLYYHGLNPGLCRNSSLFPKGLEGQDSFSVPCCYTILNIGACSNSKQKTIINFAMQLIFFCTPLLWSYEWQSPSRKKGNYGEGYPETSSENTNFYALAELSGRVCNIKALLNTEKSICDTAGLTQHLD